MQPDVRYYHHRSDAHTVTPEVFDLLSEHIAREPTLIHPPASELQMSFERGLAFVALDEANDHRPVGYVRLEPLLNDEIRGALGLPESFPQIMELGTMFTENNAIYRGQGYVASLTKELLSSHIAEIERGDLIVLGTTKDWRVINVLQKIEAAKFEVMHHLDLPHLAAFTCICSGEFGSGYQNNPFSCDSRVDDGLINCRSLLKDLIREAREFGTSIPCVMFASNHEHAKQADRHLNKIVSGDNSVRLLRDKLLKMEYYPARRQDPQLVTLQLNGACAVASV